MSWFEKGKEAAKKDTWMSLEQTLPETLENNPKIKDPIELVLTDIDGWEETDHFAIFYGRKIMADSVEKCPLDMECALDVFSDMKAEFWEGYLAGKKELGLDIFKEARKLLERKKKEEEK